MTIQFPDRPTPWYDVDRHTISFPVRVDGHPMSCVVSAADLMLRFAGSRPSSPTESLVVFEQHKNTLWRLAEAVIRSSGVSRLWEEFEIRLPEQEN